MKKIGLLACVSLSILLGSCGSVNDSNNTVSVANSNPQNAGQNTGEVFDVVQISKSDVSLTQMSITEQYASAEEFLGEKIPGYAGFYPGDGPDDYFVLVARKLGSQTVKNNSDNAALISKTFGLFDVKDRATGYISQKVRISFKTAKYSLSELNIIQNKIFSLSDKIGVSAISLDQKENKVAVYLRDQDKIKSAKAEIKSIGVSNDSFFIAGIANVKLTASATTYVRPVGSGLAIETSKGTCSMAALGKRITGAITQYGFFTAKHCVSAVSESINQGGSYLGIVSAIAPAASNGDNFDVAFVTVPMADLRKSQFAGYAFGFQSLGTYSSWETYVPTLADPAKGNFAYSHGLHGENGGQIVAGPTKLAVSGFPSANVWCFEVPQSEYDFLGGQSGGLVTTPSNAVLGIISGAGEFTDSISGAKIYTSCFLPMRNAISALSSVGTHSLY